jgi:hypothetical protein
MVLLVTMNQGQCDSTVHSKTISVRPIRRNCTLVYEYDKSFKLPLDSKEAMWRENRNCEQCGVELIARYYPDMY